MVKKLTVGEIPKLIISPSQGWISLNLKELWEYRELLYFLVWRDIKVRYRQTAVGILWVVLQPVMIMIVFSVIFGQLAKLPSDNIPYSIFTFTALLPWQLFATAITQSGNSLVSNQNLITKVYFPRLIIPISAVLGGLVDFVISFVILLAMMFYFGIFPGIQILLLPIFLLFVIITAFTIGLWLSALNVQYRDVRYVLPFLTQIWFFITPITYSSNLIPEKWRVLYGLNPMTGVIEGFRWVLLGKETGLGIFTLVSAFVVLIFLVGGLYYFRRMEKTFADII